MHVHTEGKTKSESLARRSSRDEDGHKEEGKKKKPNNAIAVGNKATR